MKKLLLLTVVVLVSAAMVTAQVTSTTTPTGNTPVAPTITTPAPPPASQATGAGVGAAIGAGSTPSGIYNGSTVTTTPWTLTNSTGTTSTTFNGTATVGAQGITATTTGTLPSYTGNVIGVLNYIPNYDVMGAHENGGRGCAGCHAPHNQARGNGGTANGYGAFADAQGGLWGQDTSAVITSYAGGITFNGGNSAHSGQLTWGDTGAGFTAANAWKDETYTGVATCLSCHDGNVSVGAMMSGVAYEQYFGLLNGVGVGLNSSRNVGGNTNVQLYGNNPIPTFLGGGFAGSNGYASQHPVGQTANANAALGKVLTTASYGLAPAITGNSFDPTKVTPNTPYGNFVASYTPAALFKMVKDPGGNFANNFVVCTTCHNQHNMAVFTGASDYSVTPPAKAPLPPGVSQVRTIFFVNGGYNPGAPYDPTHEPSTMRFCQQCHFSFSSEYFGASNIGTAY